MANKDATTFSHRVERDLRLDLFRGMGLWMIFLDHIPDDIVAWLTLRNYGFSDAAEFFVFISGYLAGFIYGPIIAAGNFLQHSLPLFCFGVFLSFVAHWILVQHAQAGARALWMQLLVSVGGILIMIGLAWLLDRAQKVPSLFVDVAEFDERKPVIEPRKA